MAVLIKGKSITCSQKSRDHYLRGKENERVTVREIMGFATKDPETALRMIEASVLGTKCEKPLYSVKINPETDRVWTKDEIRRAVDLLSENLGLKDHQRVVVEHKKKGRIHYHVLWNRFSPDGGAAKNMGNDYDTHQKTQKQLNKEFKLRPMMAKGRDFKQWEVEWAKRYGFDIFALRKEITKDFNRVNGGMEFMDALQAKGCVLCRGDKSQFVLILPWSQHKALSSMIYGRPTKAALRRAFANIDISKLPTVSEGKAIVKATLPKVKKAKASGRPYTKGRSPHMDAWKANRLLFTSHQPKLSSISVAAKTVTQQHPEYQPTLQSAAFVREAFTEEKRTPFRPDYTEEQDLPSRVNIAYEEEFNRWNGLIEAAAKDKSVPKAQRQANIAALRERQKAAAKAARKRVRHEEKSAARARRRERRILLGLPVPPQG